MTPLRLGTRGSRLAHAQAALAAEALRAAGLGPVAIVPISTAGDRDRRSAFSELGGRGVFSKELEDALLEGRIDVAVHSAKDLTTDETPGLTLAAVPAPRRTPATPGAARTAISRRCRRARASAPPRCAAARSCGALRPDLIVESLRGNVDTRLRKRVERGLDGVVLAACGLDRLDLADEIGFRVGVDDMLPETGQGFLALQVRNADADAIAAVGDAEGARGAAGRAHVRRAARRRLPRAGRRPTRSRWPTGGSGCAPGSRCPTARASRRRAAAETIPRRSAREVADGGTRARGRGDRRGGARVTVYLVGAGPGDPRLITVRGEDLLRRADVIVYDRLAGDALLDLARPDCLLIDAGKQPGDVGADAGRDDADADRARPQRRARRAPEGRRPVRVRPRRRRRPRRCARPASPTRSFPGSRRRSPCPPTRACPVTHRDLGGAGHDRDGARATRQAARPTSTGARSPRCRGTLVVLMGVARLGAGRGRADRRRQARRRRPCASRSRARRPRSAASRARSRRSPPTSRRPASARPRSR